MDSKRLQIRFASNAKQLSVRIAGSGQETAYVVDIRDAVQLPSLPHAINSDTPVEQIARQYQEFFRRLQSSTPSSLGPNAMERIFLHIGDRACGTVDLRVVSGDDCQWVSGRPWELLLHDGERDQLRDRLSRVAAVRSTGATDDYSPRRIDGSLRVLLLQGADGAQAPDFAGERLAIERAWAALGPTLQRYVNRPVIRPGFRSEIASNVAEVRPHLLWFSGHGRPAQNDFELLLGHREQEEWTPAAAFRDALLEAASRTGVMPIIVAFWACESGRPPRPSLDAGNESFPILVRAVVEAGVEAVIGVQTRIYDSSARVMGGELFRSLAEGLGPAQSLASARAELLAMPRERVTPGRGSEWTSPVMWVNGANLPAIEWARPLEKEEALAFYRLGTQSILAFEGGQDILQEAPDPGDASAAVAWVAEAPMWVSCPDLHLADRQLQVIRRMRNLVLSETKTVLIIHFNTMNHNTVLDAVADGFLDIERRAYPKPKNEAGDFLASLFEAFRCGARRKAWRELLKRPDLTVAIIADGGLPPSDELGDARSAPGALLVFSSRPAEEPEGSAALWNGWHADDFDCEGTTDMTNDETFIGFLTAIAILNKPLSQDAIDELARDFDLAPQDIPKDEYFAPLGRRLVVKTTAARLVLKERNPDEIRAAHRACMGILARVDAEFDAPKPQQLRWRVDHCLCAEEKEEALRLASQAIHILADQGNFRDIVQLYRMLGSAGRQLSVSITMDVAEAFIHVGTPRRAYDLLRQKPTTSESHVQDRLRFGVLKAEALRNLPESETRKESIAALEAAIKENTDVSPMAKDAKRWMLIAKHDLGRNIHYFQHDTPRACAIFRSVISECAADPDLAYLKTTALRNLADALDRYTYDKVERDPDAAEQHVRQAVEIADTFPSAASLLPEMLYMLAKYEYAKRPGDAGRDISRSIKLARDNGKGLVLTIAKNKQFWWQVGPLTPANPPAGFDFREWARLESELDLLIGHAWPLRALIDSRLRAAKCLSLFGQSFKAVQILERARDLLLECSILDEEGDWIHRWQPVFAGLAVLSQPTSERTRSSETDMWADLRVAASQACIHKETGTMNARQVWEEVY